MSKIAKKEKMATKQNPHFGSKIKNAKKQAKNGSITHCGCSMQKTAPKKR